MSGPHRLRTILPKIVLLVSLAAFALLVFYIYRVAHPDKPAQQPQGQDQGQRQGQGSGEGGAPGPAGPESEKEKEGSEEGKKEDGKKEGEEKKPEQAKPGQATTEKSFWERLLDVLGFDQEARANIKKSAFGRLWLQAQMNILAPIRSLFPSKPVVSPSKEVADAAKANEESMKQQQEMQDQINQGIQNNLALVKQTQDLVRTNQMINQNIKTSLETQRNIRQSQQGITDQN